MSKNIKFNIQLTIDGQKMVVGFKRFTICTIYSVSAARKRKNGGNASSISERRTTNGRFTMAAG